MDSTRTTLFNKKATGVEIDIGLQRIIMCAGQLKRNCVNDNAIQNRIWCVDVIATENIVC